jgi:hypothetical protein
MSQQDATSELFQAVVHGIIDSTAVTELQDAIKEQDHARLVKYANFLILLELLNPDDIEPSPDILPSPGTDAEHAGS